MSSIMIVAGEASGDLHGAGLCAALRALSPGTRVFGMGGERMRAAGAELLADVSRRAIVGGTEVVSSVPGFYRVYRRLRAVLERDPPSVLVLIDFPEFNLRLARAARRAGVPVVYFIPPQIWAWRGGRIRTIRRLVSLVLAVFPFERALYADAGVPVELVGHPVVDAVASAPSRAAARRALALGDRNLVIGLLPGSRHGEAVQMVPLMAAAAEGLRARWPEARFVLAQAPTLDDEVVHRAAAAVPAIAVARDAAYAVMRAADLVLVASGTATLEAALLGTPMVVCYRLSRTTELMARLLVRVPWINLVNLTLGRAAVPELRLRRELTVERVVDEARRLLESPAAREAQRAAFLELEDRLGEPGVAMRAARLILGAGLHRFAVPASRTAPPSSSEGASTAPSEASPLLEGGLTRSAGRASPTAPPSDARRSPDGSLLPAFPQDKDCGGKAAARTGR